MDAVMRQRAAEFVAGLGDWRADAHALARQYLTADGGRGVGLLAANMEALLASGTEAGTVHGLFGMIGLVATIEALAAEAC